MKQRNDAGFSLVEIMVAIVILGLITIPMTSGMIVALKTMARTEELMHAQMAVSSAVETMMADGITEESTDYIWYEGENPYPGLTVATTQAKGNETNEPLPYYIVTVTSEDGSIEVKTVIRKAGGG